MDGSLARNNNVEGNHPTSVDSATQRNFARSASLDSTVHPSDIRSSTLSRRRSSRSYSRGSVSLSREAGDSILNSIRLSHELADQLLGEIDSSALAQIIDSGDRVVSEGDVDEDVAKGLEHRVGPHHDDTAIQMHGLNSHDASLSLPMSAAEEEETVANVPTSPALDTIKHDQIQLVKSSSIKDKQYKLPRRLDYGNYLIHLAVFGFFGVFTRYALQKLFGPGCLALTSDQTPLYLDLPSNMLGSFLMGWFGIVFKADVRQISDHVIVGITTGYMGSLTTFSGWNQKMLALSSKGHWVYAVAGIVLGIFIVNESITIGVESGERIRRWILKCIEKSSRGNKCKSEQPWRVDTRTRHSVLISIMLFLLVSLWVLSIALAIVKVPNLGDGAVLWMGCSVAPPGVWLRWYLARLNGEGIGKQKYLKWLPIGTLAANVLAACIMAALAVTSKAVNTARSATILSGIQFGFLGCLSTVSTFAAEVYTMRQSGHIGRAFVYAAATFLLSFALGTLIYSVPVWVEHYK